MLKVVVEGAGSGELAYELKKPVISVGASGTNDLVIRSPGVAPTHIVFQRSGDVVTFLAQSRQVVSLNGERRARGVVRPGDKVRIGTVTLIVQEVETATVIDETAGPKDEKRAAGQAKEKEPVTRTRSEVVLYSEPSRLAEARDFMSRSLCTADVAPVADTLAVFFERFFPDSSAMLATLDPDGCFEAVFSTWSGELPQLPKRTFEELSREGRYAHLRVAGKVFLIFPVERQLEGHPFYLVVEASDGDHDEDELLLGELARMILTKSGCLETSELVAGEWQASALEKVEKSLPGTSASVMALRAGVVRAASSRQPVLVTGERGSGRTWLAGLIASLHPSGLRPVRMIELRPDSDQSFRFELYGGRERLPLAQVIERFGRGTALVMRDIHWLGDDMQAELAEVISQDVFSPFGPSLWWMATSESHVAEIGSEGNSEMVSLFASQLLKIPTFDERREDLPLIILGLIDSLTERLEKEVSGIDLATLGSFLAHGFQGQMAELVREMTRLVVATPSGEVIRGSVFAVSAEVAEVQTSSGEGSLADLFVLDDLKTVIPAVEKVIIDRVLRKTKGNQSKAARDLNLSRGALIAKMKDYSIPDYRYLRRNS